MKNSLQGVLLAGAIAGVAGGMFICADYISSRDMNGSTLRMKGEVIENVGEVYKKFGSRGRFATSESNLAGFVSAQIQKGINLGRTDFGYLVKPISVTYRTKGGILFSPKLVEKEPVDDGLISVISDVNYKGVEKGSLVDFTLISDVSIGEIFFQGRPKTLVTDDKKIDSVVFHPKDFQVLK